MTEDETRHLLVDLAASLFARGFSVGSAGNISARLDDGYLITPTNSSLGRLDPARLSRLDADFQHVARRQAIEGGVHAPRVLSRAAGCRRAWCICTPPWRPPSPACPMSMRQIRFRR